MEGPAWERHGGLTERVRLGLEGEGTAFFLRNELFLTGEMVWG